MKELLKYQEIDIELKKAEKKVTHSEYIKKVNSSKEIAKKAQIKMLELNEEAKKLALEIEKISSVKEKGIELVEKYINSNIDGLTEEEVLQFTNKIKPIKKNLEELISRLHMLEQKITNTLKEFNNSKQQVIQSKKVHDENKILLDKIKAEVEPECEEIRKELLKQEKKVNPDLLTKYRNLKREGVFPVLVPLKDGKNCGYCRVAQPMHKLEKLKLSGFTECEQCRRIILN